MPSSERSSSDVSETVLRRRAAVERWKSRNREYYLQQKRELSARPSYKAHRRELYRAKRLQLIAEGLAPRQLGRPRFYLPEEALEMRRKRAREASLRYRMKTKSQQIETYECESSETSSEDSH